MFNFANDEVISDSIGIVGLLDWQVKNVLEEYLYSVCGFTENQVTVNIQYALFDGDDALISTMKEQILAGNPVIFFGLDADLLPDELDNDAMVEGGHAMIAYDVITNADGNDDIVLHRGWSGLEYQTVRTTGYNHLNSIIWLEINEENLPHRCTNNYYDEKTKVNVCACHVYYNTHPNHKHTLFKEHYSYNNNKSHMSVCVCGYEKATPHIVSNVVKKYGVCISCGASVYVGNGPVIMPWGSNNGISDAYAVNNNIQYITDNGSYILPNGIIVLVDDDIEAYLNGELEFHYPDDNLETE